MSSEPGTMLYPSRALSPPHLWGPPDAPLIFQKRGSPKERARTPAHLAPEASFCPWDCGQAAPKPSLPHILDLAALPRLDPQSHMTRHYR